ncbi:DUF2487 family protein [Oceanobacillus halotolerans]|uniref:DUF2487 family protein n=1 Tax=Oceanobacillus halotolerans TaxID=2663380 RepID=UPI0013DA19FF|nr:DUF2487 family protein [Oceanobacillus halotolerans]
MKWIKKDLQQYINAKEYVDTIIMPLSPYHLSKDNDLGKNAFQREVLSVFTKEIETELTGRVMLIPTYHYLKNTNKQDEISRINEWVHDAETQPFQQTFFITFDSSWKKYENELEGTLLWFPSMHSGDFQSKEMHSFIRDQVSEVVDLIRSYW